MRVLCVEDDRVVGLLFAECLRPLPQLAVRVVETPEEALDTASHWPPHLLVLDAWLPGLSGHALLGRLRALPGLAAVPAYMWSADSHPEDVARALRSGFAGYWIKPLGLETLRHTMRRLAAGQAP